jgi:hypothetical protein
MATTKDPVLTVWGAMNLLAEPQARCDTIEMSEMPAETEQVCWAHCLDLLAISKIWDSKPASR